MSLAAARPGIRKNIGAAPCSTPDGFACAQLITFSTQPHVITNGDNTAYTVEPGESYTVLGNSPTKTWWGKFVAPITGKMILSVTPVGGVITGGGGSPFDALIGVYTGTAVGALTQIHASDNEWTNFATVAGTTYYVQIGGYLGASGAFSLHLAANDDLINAWDISATPTGTKSFFEGKMSFDAGEPAPLGYTGGTVWYKFTVGSIGGDCQFDTIGSNATPGGHDSVLAVYTSSTPLAPTYGSLTLVQANDQGGGGNDAKINFTSVAGATYFIQVMPMYNGTLSGYKFNWSVSSYTTLSVGPAADTAFGGGAGANSRVSQQFTPTASSVIRKMTVTFIGSPAAGTVRIGVHLSTALTTASREPTSWIAYIDVVNPSSGPVTINFGTDVALTAGGDYRFSVVGETGQRLAALGYKFTPAVPVGGTSANVQYTDDTTQLTTTALEMPFTAFGP